MADILLYTMKRSGNLVCRAIKEVQKSDGTNEIYFKYTQTIRLISNFATSKQNSTGLNVLYQGKRKGHIRTNDYGSSAIKMIISYASDHFTACLYILLDATAKGRLSDIQITLRFLPAYIVRYAPPIKLCLIQFVSIRAYYLLVQAPGSGISSG